METDAPRALTAQQRQLIELVFRKPPLTNAEIAERMARPRRLPSHD